MSKVCNFPVAIVEDRYCGAYSGGGWIAISNADAPFANTTRINWLLDGAAFGGDRDCEEFWDSLDAEIGAWLAVGATPQAALDALSAKTCTVSQ